MSLKNKHFKSIAITLLLALSPLSSQAQFLDTKANQTDDGRSNLSCKYVFLIMNAMLRQHMLYDEFTSNIEKRAIDQYTKMLVHSSFNLNETIGIIEGYFNLTYVRNNGAACVDSGLFVAAALQTPD